VSTDSSSSNAGKMENGCAFCEIAAGRDDTVEIVCSDPKWVAFFPDNPATPGHTLVIPREHVRDLWVADLALGTALFEAVSKVGNAIWHAVAPEGMNLITSSGEAAEQTVFHLHFHLVPRWAEDRLDIWPPKEAMAKEVKEDLAAAVRAACVEGQRS
jgi:histidine triad (HIT) family protein